MDSINLFEDIKNKSAAYIRQFIETNIPSVNTVNPVGLTALHFAAEHESNVEVAKVLISMGANVNFKGSGGITPLHLAVTYGNIEMAKVLMSNGADVNVKEDNGMTPIHIAALAGRTSAGKNVEIAKILVSNGADVNARSNINPQGYSYTPLDFARQMGDTAMVQYLGSV